MNRKSKNRFLLFAVMAIIISGYAGCASFSTTQTDMSYDENGKPQRQIATKATARTLFEAKSALAQFKATQTDKTQSATVGSLNQEASGTNSVAVLEKVTDLLKTLK